MNSHFTASETSAGLPVPARSARYASFGKFILDLHREELYQGGQRLRVQGKLLQALRLLIAKPGEIISREELRRSLWPDSDFASRDANVNTAINKLRQVLGDSSDNPLYIETVPRRGYSFIAALEFCDTPKTAVTKSAELGNSLSVASVSFTNSVLSSLLGSHGVPRAHPLDRRHGRRRVDDDCVVSLSGKISTPRRR